MVASLHTDGNEATSGDREVLEMSVTTLSQSNDTSQAVDRHLPDGCINCGQIGCVHLNSSMGDIQCSLVYRKCERLKLKDFSVEVRASLDVEQFVSNAELILDMTVGPVDEIVETILERLLAQGSMNSLTEAKNTMFLSGTNSMTARTIQAAKFASSNSMQYDKSWLVALCDLTTINKRHIAVARFKEPVNMGENASYVKLFTLILAPYREKGTKNSLEMGRTFATMFTDSVFRQRLLEVKNVTLFKSLMLIKAQELSESECLDSKHRYMVDLANYMVNTDQATWKSQQKSGGMNNLVQPITPASFQKHPRGSKVIELINQVDEGKSGQNDGTNGHRVVEVPKSSGDDTKCCGLGAICSHAEFGKGLYDDLCRRIKCYPSDFIDGFVGPPKTLTKTIATTWFLYFGILLPTIAFSSLNNSQTDGLMGDLRKAIIGQAIGGLGFALFAGQPLVIIMTTAPLCLYTKVIHQMCIDYNFNYLAMYSAVGLWNAFFLFIYSFFGFSRLMRWCTRSTEEIFALFIVVAFITDAGKDMLKNFREFYYSPACNALDMIKSQGLDLGANITTTNRVSEITGDPSDLCRRETSVLFVLLMFGTLWLGTTLLRFKKTLCGPANLLIISPYLAAAKRELLADYSLPVAVLAMSFVGSFVFDDIQVEKHVELGPITFEGAQLENLPVSGILTAMVLGFTLSLLFFMDQNISAAMVNAPQNNLKKGSAYHFDLLIVASLNVVLTFYGLPMMHGVLPHSPLHVRSLADVEKRFEDGHSEEVITNVRETRMTGVLSHILLALTLYLIPYPIGYIPTAVLNGLFLYMAVTSLDGLRIFERITLLFTEQSSYPPNHYIRRCPQRKIHLFTFLQLLQLLVMCLFGFSPINVIEMFFPVIILLMIPFRHLIVPKLISDKCLNVLDVMK